MLYIFIKDNEETVKVFIKSALIKYQSVTFWHETCLKSIKQLNFIIMKELIKQYENAKKSAKTYMKNGQINAYFEALLEMNKYKRMMVAVVAN